MALLQKFARQLAQMVEGLLELARAQGYVTQHPMQAGGIGPFTNRLELSLGRAKVVGRFREGALTQPKNA